MNNTDMENIEDEIAYRSSLLEAARKGQRLSADERCWLSTHSAFSARYGYPYLSMDILKMSPEVKYNITVRLISSCSKHTLTPTFSVPHGKGHIQWTRQDGAAEKAKMLSTANSKNEPVSRFSFKSEQGIMAVSYHYKTRDHRGAEFWNSSTIDDRLAMKKTAVRENEVIYSCTDIDGGGFDKYVFSVSWEAC